MKRFSIVLAACALMAVACGPKDGVHTLTVLTTNDIHGAWFDSTYVGDRVTTSLMAVNTYVDEIRQESGADNFILLDAGDILQGENCAYYYNFVATQQPHPYPEIAAYMGYDAIVVGNHDVETGHPVYDKVAKQLQKEGIPFLAGNTPASDGKSYFKSHALLKKAGLKVLVIGYTNANMKAWLQEELWQGMDFQSTVAIAQKQVDELTAKYKPQVVIVAAHTGTGHGNGEVLESEGLDLLNSLHGVDLVCCAHDHRAVAINNESGSLVNAGSKCRNIGRATISVETKGGKVVSRGTVADVIDVDPQKTDKAMSDHFHHYFAEVKEFTNAPIGELAVELRSRDAFAGMSGFINFVHTVQISVPEAKISFAAPLNQNGVVKPGTLIFNDMFTLYPYENQMFVVNLTGQEIVNYLEYSYNSWIQTPGEHVLRIVSRSDPRYNNTRWSFTGASFNFDSAAGLNYKVDVSKPYGSRIIVESLADGTPFNLEDFYPVAMTSYRASGGGDILPKGAGITSDILESRTIAKYPEIREMMYDFIKKHGTITSEIISDESVLGSWKFVPESAEKLVQNDMELMFGR